VFEKFLSINEADFRQRYEGTYGFYRNEDGKKMLVQLSRINRGECHFVDIRGVDYYIKADSEKNVGFEFIPPRSSYYNTDTAYALLVKRVAERQFHRGIYNRNTSITSLGKSGFFAALPINFETLEKVYLKAFSYRDAFQKWNDKVSVAISPQFALCIPTSGVYIWEKKIGTFTKDNDKKNHFNIKLDDSDLWKTELVDTFKLLDCTVEIS
jgi:hypothetical protein